MFTWWLGVRLQSLLSRAQPAAGCTSCLSPGIRPLASTIQALLNGLVVSLFQHVVAHPEGYHYFESKAFFSFCKAFCVAGRVGWADKETPNWCSPAALPLSVRKSHEFCPQHFFFLSPPMLWKVSFTMYCLSHNLRIFLFSNQSKNCYSEFWIISMYYCMRS